MVILYSIEDFNTGVMLQVRRISYEEKALTSCFEEFLTASRAEIVVRIREGKAGHYNRIAKNCYETFNSY